MQNAIIIARFAGALHYQLGFAFGKDFITCKSARRMKAPEIENLDWFSLTL